MMTGATIKRLTNRFRNYFAGRNGTGVNVVARHAVLRPVSSLLIISMVGLSLQPLIVVAQIKDSGTLPPQIAQWLPKTQAAQATAGTSRAQNASDAAPTPSGLIAIEEALKRAVPERFATAQQLKSVSTVQVLIRTAHTVLAQQDSVAAETQRAREQFTVDRERLQQASLEGGVASVDPALFQRHTDTVAAFEARAAEFVALTQALKRSTSQDATQTQRSDTKSALQALAAFIKKYPNQRAHQATDPNNLPFKLAKAEVRAPIEDGLALARYSAQAQRSKRGMPTPAASLYPLLPDIARRIERAPLNIPTPAQMDRLDRAKSATTKAASAADIVPPAAADLAETEDVQLTPAIRAKAAALNYSPVEIYNWVRNNIEFLPTYGSIQGSDMTLLTGKGNAFDTASLTIALLRASGIYAKYVYGAVEIPADQVQNWVGNVKTPEAAQSLMSQGGIPNVALVSGGKIAAFRLEHVWVEAYVNYYPSRGANHRGEPANTPASPRGTPGDTWVPFDASFKQFAYSTPLDIVSLAGININDMRTAASAGAVVDPAGAWVKGVDGAGFAQSFEDAQHQALAYLAKNKPNATADDLLGKRTINPEVIPYSPGSLRVTRQTVSLRTAELPAAMRWTIDLGYYGSDFDLQLDSPSAQTALSLPKLNIKRLGVKPVPAGQADADTLAALAASGATQLNPYSISVKPQLQLDGAPLITAPTQRMGDTVYWSLTINGPGQTPRRADYKFNTGDEVVFGVNAIGIDPKQQQTRHALFNTVNASNNLQQVALAYWAQHDVYDELLASTAGQTTQRLPSAGAFATRLNVRYFFGVPRTGYYLGRSMDVKQNLRTNAGGTAEQTIKVAIESGIHGSYLEGFTFDTLFGHERGTGLSATGILQSLQAQGAKIYKIDAANIATTLPNIQTTADVKADISNAVAAGQYAVIAERELTQGRWTGAGYYLIDPATGAGAYLLDGGYAGGDEGPDCQLQPVTQPAGQPTVSPFASLFFLLGIIFLVWAAINAAPVIAAVMLFALATSANAATPPMRPLSLTPGQQAAWDVRGAGQFPSGAPEDMPQTCDNATLDRLRAEKKSICKDDPRKARCEDGESCADSEDKIKQRYECIAARVEEMVVCFGGGNYGHWLQVGELLNGINTCRKCLAKSQAQQCK